METVESDENWHGAKESLEDQEEKRVLYGALDSFSQYRRKAHFNVTHRRRQNFYALPLEHQQILREPPFEILAHFDRVDDAIDKNAEIAKGIFESGLEAFGIPMTESGSTPACNGSATPNDVDKAKSTLRQFYREWSVEGAVERNSCYGVILRDLERLFVVKSNREATKVLIPGAGLGRLVYEVCRLGFDVEGNEISFHQLLASNWILNRVKQNEKFDLFPSALTFSNQTSKDNQLLRVLIPDVHPGLELELSSRSKRTHAFERMAMTAADFVVLYSEEEHQQMFDVVASVFFIDTAPNVIRYIETIHSTLKNGGIWINIGPLLWHFEDRSPPQNAESSARINTNAKAGIEEPGCFELSSNDLTLLIERMGFAIEAKEIRDDGTGYIQDPACMVQSSYKTLHFIARKQE